MQAVIRQHKSPCVIHAWDISSTRSSSEVGALIHSLHVPAHRNTLIFVSFPKKEKNDLRFIIVPASLLF